MIRYARHLLEESRVPLSAKGQFMRLVSSIVDLRSCGEGYCDSSADRMTQMTFDLAASIDTPLAWFNAWQELAGYYRMRGFVDEAEECFEHMDALKQIIPAGLIDVAPSYRAKIELYLEHDPDRAIDLIEREYLSAYQANPRALFREHLERWSKQFGISIPKVQTYETPVVFYAPRGEL
jgi:tetratricopeptide (TPR) repeat protein